MEELTFFYELQINQTNEGIFTDQSKCTKKFLKKFSMENAKASLTPMRILIKLDMNENVKEVNMKMYPRMIGSSLYLMFSPPDIIFSVYMCEQL